MRLGAPVQPGAAVIARIWFRDGSPMLEIECDSWQVHPEILRLIIGETQKCIPMARIKEFDSPYVPSPPQERELQ